MDKLYKKYKIAVVGLGYVGLPLALAFDKEFITIGYDIDNVRINALKSGIDITNECTEKDFQETNNIEFTDKLTKIKDCNIYIITVPTPIDINNNPNFMPLISASKQIASILNKNDIVIYESTVYPGATEEICIPILEQYSNLLFNQDFFVGYSPERINPGDKTHRLTNITKVVSGSTSEITNEIDAIYKKVISAGTYKVSSICVAEAAKVIENTQRDVNIALINELAIIFNQLNIDTQEVLDAAGTKWNFLPFRPGLVGGHCIGVDPYYLTYKAQSIGYHPEIILSGRRINDGMGKYIVNQFIKCLVTKEINIVDAKILILGLSFKENCPDIRNSKVKSIYDELSEYKFKIDVYDPWVDKEYAIREYNIQLLDSIKENYDGIIIAVAHNEFMKLSKKDFTNMTSNNSVIYDLKSVVDKTISDIRL